MNFLFETYEFLYPIILVSDSRQCSKRWDPSQEVEMFVMAFMTLLCTGGAMFCVRFLVALCKARASSDWLLGSSTTRLWHRHNGRVAAEQEASIASCVRAA